MNMENAKNRIVEKVTAREKLTGFLMVLPALVFFLAFVLYPAIRTFTYSLYDWDMLTEAEFVGLENFKRLFADERLGPIIGNTLLLTVFSVVLKICVGFLLAYLVFVLRNRFGSVFMEGAIFFPIIIPMSVVAMVFGMLMNTDTGALNAFLWSMGLQKVDWLTKPRTALFSIVLVDVWKGAGFFFIIYLVALREIPSSYLEAADIDGANAWQKMISIMIPCVSSTSLFLIVNAMITSLQLFDPVYLMTRGGPGDSTTTISYYLWENAFQDRDVGYGSAIALVLFVFVMLVTVLQFALSKLWVHYENDK